MGHEIGFVEYPGTLKQKEVYARIAGFAYDPRESSCYHGNLTFHDNYVYEDYDAAEAAINRFDNGWYSDHAVKFKQYNIRDIKKSAKILNLQERIKRYQESKKKILEDNDPKNFKAKLVTCKSCGSKINKKFIHSTFCPVCRNDMLSKTAQNRIETIDHNITECYQKIHEEELRIAKKQKPEIMWLVKYEYHC